MLGAALAFLLTGTDPLGPRSIEVLLVPVLGMRFYTGKKFPAQALTDEDIDSLVDYIAGLGAL